jgi:hypothetical protein
MLSHTWTFRGVAAATAPTRAPPAAHDGCEPGTAITFAAAAAPGAASNTKAATASESHDPRARGPLARTNLDGDNTRCEQ